MTLYATAAEKLLKKRPEKVSLYLTETERFADISVSEIEFEKARETIRNLLEADRSGVYPRREDRCDDCRHRPWCIKR